MLCDDLVYDSEFQTLYDGLPSIVEKIRRAEKFQLSQDFTLAAQGLVDNLSEIEKVSPYCRLPYPLMWMEFSQSNRPKWKDGRPIDASRHQAEPIKVGFLFEQIERASCWDTHMFWSMKNNPDRCPYNGSVLALMFDTEKDFANQLNQDMGRKPSQNLLDRIICSHGAFFGNELMQNIFLRDRSIHNTILDYAVEDWGGEARFILAALGLLNARNTSEIELISKDEHNAKRAKQGRPPLFSHHLLKIHPFQMNQLVRDERGVIRTGELRSHFVRGHWKERSSGLYWWNTHRRGNYKVGLSSKTYEVEGD